MIYAIPRAEIVNTLNRTLQKTPAPAKLSPFNRQQSHPKFNRQEVCANHPDTIASLADAAFLYERQRRYGEAERLYKQVLTLRQQQFGEMHQCVSESLSELAALYSFQQRYAEVIPLLQRSLKIRQQLLARDHLEIGLNLHHLADAYHYQQQYKKAKPLFQQALVIFRQQLGVHHPKTQSVYSGFMQMLAAAIASDQV